MRGYEGECDGIVFYIGYCFSKYRISFNLLAVQNVGWVFCFKMYVTLIEVKRNPIYIWKVLKIDNEK